MPNLPSITGQILVNKCKTRMGGYANAFSSDDILDAVNEAKDEVWAILKDLKKNYFVAQSQSTTPSNEDFFDKLSTTVRDYTLPTRFREMRMIECITAGFEHLAFNEMDFASPEFQQERRESSLTGVGVKGASEYMYAIVGNKFLLAQFPEAANLDLRLWFVEAIPDLALGDTLTDILVPFSKKIPTYAVKRLLLGVQEEGLFERWKEEWKSDVLSIETSAGSRGSANPVFVDDYLG